MKLFESALTPQKARKMPKKSNNEKKKDAEAAGRPPKKTKQANKILIVDKHFCYEIFTFSLIGIFAYLNNKHAGPNKRAECFILPCPLSTSRQA